MKSHFFLAVFFTALFSISFSSAKSQTFNLPEGYSLKDANGNLGERNDNDFDGDGMTDLAIICFPNDDSSPIVVVYLTTKYLVSGTYSWFPWQHMMNEFEYKNNVLTLISSDLGRFGTTLKLKYYSSLNNMRLIGWEDSSMGDMNGEGEYSKSINLLTNQYAVNGVLHDQTFDVITLSNIELYFDALYKVGEQYIGK